ncbi:Adaptin ear-binding coat-associated protein 1 NECAP-1 [Moelleriella libera RCEF 2490]|uniref:Adaptin ear-binding coat-associated protein 1 NECAP-1 n=1 Tax=Moelleriella libera RCEF 2490 TaxID=1081109 RepID=A0A167ZF13_9HYPO|nr:Adaptin ear-binding coat-associated protein 1 NECAP-1 [Moelleriella libera RCEF 2490]
MDLLDPATGRPLPSDAIQRVLFIGNAVHVYNIPPLSSMKGHTASTWTADPARHIFTARLRVVETACETPSSDAKLKVDIVLEDASNGQLFAAAPYSDRSAIEPVLDSSRFFALTVRDPNGRKAVLGIGFEERSDAFDLSIALQEARRALGLEETETKKKDDKQETAKDYRLKEGETITVNIGNKSGRRRPQQPENDPPRMSETASLQSFVLSPPPSATSSNEQSGFALPLPPSASDIKRKRRSLKDLGFDDGQFGEFA